MRFEFATRGDDVTPLYLIEKRNAASALDALDDAARSWVELSGFSGELGQIALVPDGEGAVSEALFGWGDAEARANRRFALGDFAAKAPKGDYQIETGLRPDEAEEAALAWFLSAYRFDRYKETSPQAARLVAPDGVDAARILNIAEAAAFARDLINTPANDMGPEDLAVAAWGLAERFGARCETTVGEALLEARLPMIHAVGRASTREPRLIDLTWGAEDAPKVTLVGKGVCFDTGGLDLKTAAGMKLMKKDMGGAANVLALAQMIMAAALPVRLRVLIPAVENSVAGDAFRPGDILSTRKGLTVEIGNTDAEGRLVLADALTLASEEDPALLIDMATLTGAARVAVGTDLAAFFTDDEAAAADLIAGAYAARDPVWRMPLWSPYDDDLKSGAADLNNISTGGYAGAITAGLFLRRFVDKGAPWVHFDIMAWNLSAKPGRPAGGECMAARAAFAMIEARYGG